jgi:DNA gyrase subunit A
MTETEQFPEISIEDEMKKSYLDYAMSVIIGRALPDVRDGLKPVHRRILFAMHETRNDWNKPYKKSARIVGDVIGKYHPHGDTAVYDTIVRMAQDFSMRYPLVDGQGNFGSVDGDAPAAMRYTEVRMTRPAHQMLEDLEKETVDFAVNYDESLQEPSVLPAKLPLLLINGSSGIAVGMATNIPPHNLSEVIDAVVALIDNPALTLDELMRLMHGPDFPTGGIIYGTQGIRDAYATGRGVIRIRARVEVEESKKDNRHTIVINEIPYQVNKARVIEKIAELVKNKQIEGIRFVRDESGRQGMRIAVGLKKDQYPEVVINQLYKHTQLQNSFGIIFLAVVGNRPELLTLKQILEHFIGHRKEIVLRRTLFELKKAQARAHILEGLKIALDHLDEVVALIRRSATPVEAKSGLVETFDLTPIQAQAILDMRLQRLTGLERDKILEEYESLLKDIERYEAILSSEQLVLDIIKEELLQIRSEFGDERRTEIVEATAEITLEDMIAEEDMVVTISRSGYIKRNPISLYQSQHRGGKGKRAMATREEDVVQHLFVASTHHTFLFFTNQGKVYWSKVYELPMAGRTSLGKAIVNLLDFDREETLTTVLNVPSFETGRTIIMATANGLIKKTDLMAYSRPMSRGIIALDLVPGDELISAGITDGSMDILLSTADGKSIRFHETDIRQTGRVARGVRGMRLVDDDRIVSMSMVSDVGETLLTATENGFGKRTALKEYHPQRRGGKGVITIKKSERNGQVVASLLVNDHDDVMLVTSKGKLIRIAVDGIPLISRNTQGVKLIGMDVEESVVGVVRLAEHATELEDVSDDDPSDALNMDVDDTAGPDES